MWCLIEVAGKRQIWCSNKCSDTVYELTDWGFLKSKVRERDHGVCQECGTDTYADRKRVYEIAAEEMGITYRDIKYSYTVWHCIRNSPKAKAEVERLGITPGRWDSKWYDVDHIVPLAEGGANAVDNLRTLCIACHKAHSKALAGRLADARRNRLKLDLEPS